MSMESEQIFALSKFNEVILGAFFADCDPGLAERGRNLCRFLWNLDGRCHTQDWEGVTDRVAVFSLPVHLRRWRTSKNYASVYRPLAGETALTLEVILPSRAELRERVMGSMPAGAVPQLHALGQPRFRLGPDDPIEGYSRFIREARRAKTRPLSEYLERGGEKDGGEKDGGEE